MRLDTLCNIISNLTQHRPARRTAPRQTSKVVLLGITNLLVAGTVWAALTPPTNLHATSVSSKSVTLSWTDSNNVKGENYVLVGRKLQAATTFSNLATLTAGTQTYTDGTVASATTYNYLITIYPAPSQKQGGPVSSGILSVATAAASDTTAPSVPTGLTATAGSTSQINLSWSASTDTGGSGLAGYKVYRNGALIDITAATSYSNTGLSANTQYCYTVLAYDNAGNASGQSAQACATTQAISDTTPPSVPTGLTASVVSSSQINLSWSASTDTGGSGLAGYRIYRNGALLTTTTSTSYSVMGLSANTTYTFTVAAYDNAGNVSAQSTAVSATTQATTDTTAPSVPSGLTATAGSTSQINLSWSASTDTGGSGLAGYKVYRSGVLIDITTATSYSNTGLTANTQYCYTVAAYDNAGNVSGQSAQACATTQAVSDTTPPSVPTGLTASAASCSQINLSWSAATDTGGSGLAGYRIYKNGALLTTTTSTSYSVTGLSASTIYLFTVAAYDNAGNVSAQSSAYNISTPSCDTNKPTVPTGLTASAASCSQINLSWSAATDTGGSGLAGYKVYRDGILIATTAATSYSNTGLTASTTYSFTVAAYDNAGNVSAQSTAASRLTPACSVATPGSTVWAQAFTSPLAIGYAIATDASNNIFVAGYFTGTMDFGGGPLVSAGGNDIFVAKVLANGITYQWAVRFGGTGDDQARSIAVDHSGNVYVTGWFTGPGPVTFGTNTLNRFTNLGGKAIFLVKLAGSSGSVLWARQIAGLYGAPPVDNFGNDVVFDSTYISGTTTGAVVLAGQAGGEIDFGKGMVVTSGFLQEPFLAKCDLNGNYLWAKSFTSSMVCDGRAVTVGADGSIYLLGGGDAVNLGGGNLYVPSGASFLGVYLAKFSSAGTYSWGEVFGCAYNAFASGVVLTPNGNVAVLGSLNGILDFGSGISVTNVSASGQQMFVAEFSTANGVPQWAKTPTVPSGSVCSPWGISTDGNGNIVAVGSLVGSVDFGGGTLNSTGKHDIFVAKYLATGSISWAKNFGGSGDDEGVGCAVDALGNPVVTGYTTGGSFGYTSGGTAVTLTTGGNYEPFLLKLAP